MPKNRFEIEGRLKSVEPYTSKAGKTSLTLVLEIDGNYPQLVPIKVFGRAVDYAKDCKPGDTVSVTGRLGGRDWQGRVYGDNVAEAIEVLKQSELPLSSNPPAEDTTDVPF